MNRAEKLQAIHNYYYQKVSSKQDLTFSDLRWIERYISFMAQRTNSSIENIGTIYLIKKATKYNCESGEK